MFEPTEAERKWWDGVPAVSSWHRLSLWRAAPYLGYIVGVCVTPLEQFEPQIRKFEAALERFKTRALPPHLKVFVLNLFVLSLFSYKGQFCAIPTKVYSRIRMAIVSFLFMLNVCRATYLSTLQSLGFHWAVRDVSCTALASQIRASFVATRRSPYARWIWNKEGVPGGATPIAVQWRIANETLSRSEPGGVRSIHNALLLKHVNSSSPNKTADRHLQREVYKRLLPVVCPRTPPTFAKECSAGGRRAMSTTYSQ